MHHPIFPPHLVMSLHGVYYVIACLLMWSLGFKVTVEMMSKSLPIGGGSAKSTESNALDASVLSSSISFHRD